MCFLARCNVTPLSPPASVTNSIWSTLPFSLSPLLCALPVYPLLLHEIVFLFNLIYSYFYSYCLTPSWGAHKLRPSALPPHSKILFFARTFRLFLAHCKITNSQTRKTQTAYWPQKSALLRLLLVDYDRHTHTRTFILSLHSLSHLKPWVIISLFLLPECTSSRHTSTARAYAIRTCRQFSIYKHSSYPNTHPLWLFTKTILSHRAM